jgi:large subunit ribosomal protein L22
MAGYTKESDPETTARAIGREMSISPRHSIVICRHIKGWRLERAKDFLAEVIELKSPVPDTRYGGSGHRRGKVGPGRFPEKAAKQILKVLG